MEDVKGNCPLECDCCEQWAESASAPPSGALLPRCRLPPPSSLLPVRGPPLSPEASCSSTSWGSSWGSEGADQGGLSQGEAAGERLPGEFISPEFPVPLLL